MESNNRSTAWVNIVRKMQRLPGLLQMLLLLLALTIEIPAVALSNSLYQFQIEDIQRRELQETYDVIIVGAGAAGLGAARTLEQNGITNYVILEAADQIGGRVKKDTTFLDWPIEAGAMYIPPPFLEEMEEIAGIELPTIFVPGSCGRAFQDYTYWDFFNDYVKPSDEKIILNCKVEQVNYGTADELVEVVCVDGRTFVANHVIITVPLSILRSDDIVFTPSVDDVLAENPRDWWLGFKIFIEFENRFYDDRFCLWPPCQDELGENGFRDYAPLAPASQSAVPNILVGSISGDNFEQFRGLTEEQILDSLLEIFAEYFSLSVEDLGYTRHILFNWSEDPYTRGTYSSWWCPRGCHPGNYVVNNQVLFAGEAFAVNGDSQSFVYSGFHSGIEAASMVMTLPPPPPPRTSSQCFSPQATATVLGKGAVQMKDLAVGDRVLTSTGIFEPVYSIDHYSTKKLVDYIVIESDLFNEQPLEVSPRHMLYISGKDYPVPAGSVTVHDYVRTLSGLAKVVNISTVTREGFFNPLTPSGNIVVDGLVASTYSSYSEVDSKIELFSYTIISIQELVHMAAVPYHWFCSLNTISSKMCNEHDEWALASEMLVKLGTFWVNQCESVQLFVLSGYIFLFGIANFIIFNKSIFVVFMIMLISYRLIMQHEPCKKTIMKAI